MDLEVINKLIANTPRLQELIDKREELMEKQQELLADMQIIDEEITKLMHDDDIIVGYTLAPKRKCRNCGQIGHTSRTCKEPKRN